MKKFLLFLVTLSLWAGSSWAVTITIGTGTSTGRYPLDDYYVYSRSQMLYLASEMTTGGTITNLRWYRNDVGADPAAIGTTEIWLMETTATTLSGTAWEGPGTLVATISNIDLGAGGGWFDIDITDFGYGGTNNLLVSVRTQNAPYTTPHALWRYTSTSTNYRARAGQNDLSNPPTMALTYSRPNIQFEILTTSPNLTVVPGTLNFGGVPFGSSSPEKTYVLSGTYLTAGPIVVTAPAGFGISLTPGGPYTSTVNVDYTPPTLANTTIYALFTPPAANTVYTDLITHVGGSASKTLPVTGSSWVITPTFSCQSISASFPTSGLKIAVNLTTSNAYNFSCCNLDGICAGSGGPGNDMDFTMYGTDGVTQLWYIDGASACNWNATTRGSTYDSWVPPANGTYYLLIDDYAGIAGSFTMGYIASVPLTSSNWTGLVDSDWNNTGNWSSGSVPDNTVKVTIPASCPNYPNIIAPASCNKLTIANGGSVTMTSSFFDIFTEISCSGILDISGGTISATGNLYLPVTTGTLIMSNGTLNVAAIFQTAAYTWSNGTYALSGGTINVTGSAFFSGGTGSTMSGNHIFNVGGTLQINNLMWTMTGGTINLLGTEAATNYFLPPSATGTAYAYNLNVNSNANSYVFSRDASVNQDIIVNNFQIISGNVNLLSGPLGTGNPGTFTVGGDLTVAANSTANLTIPAVTTFTVTGNTYQSLKSTTGYGSIIGYVNGQYNLNVEIEGLAAGRWILISPPVPGLTATMFGCQYLQKHDPITNTWIDMTPAEPLVPGIDYALWVHPDVLTAAAPCAVIPPLTSFTWTGVMNTGAIVAPLLCDDPILEGWNNVGNPYQATLDWNSAGLTKTNVNDAIYFENNGLWASYVGGVGANGGTQYIAPNQGFFVQCNNIAGGSLGFATSATTHTRTAFFKNDVTNMVRLQASGNNRTDETVIRFTDEATAGFDGNFDARKFYTSVMDYPEIPQIYSTANGNLSINSLPATEMVAVGFKAGIAGEYSINTTESSDFSNLVLEDLQTGTFTDLLNKSYTFSHELGNNESRFILHFAPLAISENQASPVKIYASQKDVYISVPANTHGNCTVFNLMGQEIAKARIDNMVTKKSIGESGIYIVKVIIEGQVFTQKVIIQ